LIHVLFAMGYPDQAWKQMRDSLAYARELAHPYTLAYALSVACLLHGRLPPGREARIEADTLFLFATAQGFPLPAAVGAVVAGWALADDESAAEGIARMRCGLADYQATGAELWVPDLRSLLAQAYGRTGQPAAGLELLAETLGQVERTGGRWLEAELYRLRGELLLAAPEPDPAAAEACFGRALAVARAQDARMWELRAATSLARLWCDQGRTGGARELLAPVFDWFTEGFDTPDLIKAKRLIGALGD
jgi:predicted ATPase